MITKSHPFKDDDKLRAALKYLSNLLDFQEGLGCHIYVENAHDESNNGFATKFTSGREVEKGGHVPRLSRAVSGCLGLSRAVSGCLGLSRATRRTVGCRQAVHLVRTHM